MLESKHAKKTTLSLLEQDFRRLFKVFLTTSKEPAGVKKEVRGL
jgi:hypothetical protein